MEHTEYLWKLQPAWNIAGREGKENRRNCWEFSQQQLLWWGVEFCPKLWLKTWIWSLWVEFQCITVHVIVFYCWHLLHCGHVSPYPQDVRGCNTDILVPKSKKSQGQHSYLLDLSVYSFFIAAQRPEFKGPFGILMGAFSLNGSQTDSSSSVANTVLATTNTTITMLEEFVCFVSEIYSFTFH